MNLSKISLLVVPLLALSLIIGASTAEAFGGRGGEKQGGMHGGFGFGFGPGGQSDKVTVQVTKLENGIQTTVTTDDSDMLKQLHTQTDKFVLMQSIQHSVTNIESGVRITITTTDPEQVERIQQMAAGKNGQGMPGGRMGGGHRGMGKGMGRFGRGESGSSDGR